jgi:hypothetical protein
VGTHWIDPPAGYSPYAPKWARDPCARRYGQLRTADLAEDKTGRAEEGIGSILARAGDPLRPESNPSVNHFLERSLQPDIVPYPSPTARHAPVPFNARDILYGSIIGVAAGLAMTLFMIGKLPPTGSIEAGDSAGAAPFAARFAGQPSARAATEQIGPADALSNNPVGISPERRL